MNVSSEQLPAPANAILADFIDKLINIQPGLLKGVYLTGSIPLGDYHPQKSDIDFIVLLKEIPGSAIINILGQIHIGIEKKYHQPKLNGFYITPDGLKTETYFTSFFGKKMAPAKPFEPDSIILFELQKASYTLYGTPARELPVTININDVLSRIHHNLNNYWARWITAHSGLNIGYLLLLLFPGLTEWGILGVLRQLYTLETGQITSKLEAGNYYLNYLPAIHYPIILTAIETRKVNGLQLKPSFKRAQQTIVCMSFIIQRFNDIYLDNKISY